MTINYTILDDPQLVLVAWDGLVSWDQWRAHGQRMLGDPAFRAARLQLTDLRSASLDESINEAALGALRDYLAAQPPPTSQKKIAIVPDTAWEQAKLVEKIIASLGARPLVFASLSTACTWLGVDTAEVAMQLERLKAQMRGAAPQ
ncbi:MAG: hypothetical protein ACM3MF_06345 [Anaerolineae bacterium]